MVAKVKRVQVVPIGKDNKLSGVLTVEDEEVNGKTGAVRDQLHTFYLGPDDGALRQVKPGDEISVEVRPWCSEKVMHYEFVRFVGKSGKA